MPKETAGEAQPALRPLLFLPFDVQNSVFGIQYPRHLCYGFVMTDAPTDKSAGRTRDYIELAQLVAGLAHEIKNPLSTVHMNLKLLSEDLARFRDEEHERLARRLQRTAAEADRVEKILGDFLRYAGKVELQLAPTDLREVIRELCEFFAPQADAARVVLRPAFPEQPLPCRIDANLIKQAILNLMINAIQVMPDGGELLVKAATKDDQAVVEVIDTGPGIEPAHLADIFRAYWSTRKDGTGLGLPTARRILREHGGTLDVDSELGKGTRFILTLPLADAARNDESRTNDEIRLRGGHFPELRS
jgi:signal transduction histidine kinase